MQAQATPAPTYISQDTIKSLRKKFARLIIELGANNSKGTRRYNFEVEFCYAMRELEEAPPYLMGKLFDRAANVCNALDQTVKSAGAQQATA
jgi:hypothetical protein